MLFSLSIPPANDPLNRELSAEARCRMQSEWEMLRVTARDSPSSFYSTLQVSHTTAASTKTCWTELHERKCIHIHCHCRCRLWSQPLRKLLCCKKPISFLLSLRVRISEHPENTWLIISVQNFWGGVLGNFYLVDSKSGEKYPCLYWKWKMRHGLEYHRVMMLKFSCSFLEVENPFHVQP